MSNNTELIPCLEKDLETVAAMADNIWNDYYGEFLPASQISYMLGTIYSIDALKEQIKAGQEFYIIRENGAAAGFISISSKGANSYFIHKFYIYTSMHKHHIGSRVMDMIKSEFSKRSAGSEFDIRLTVNRQNYKAINFYFKNGFTIDHVEDFDIGNGYFMNDFVMLCRYR